MNSKRFSTTIKKLTGLPERSGILGAILLRGMKVISPGSLILLNCVMILPAISSLSTMWWNNLDVGEHKSVTGTKINIGHVTCRVYSIGEFAGQK